MTEKSVQTSNPHLNKAFELLGALKFSELIEPKTECSYYLDHGKISCDVLYRKDQIEIINCFTTEPCEIRSHTHDEKEFYIVYEGTAFIYYGQECKEINAGGSFYIEPYIHHALKTNGACSLIIARIPSMKGASYLGKNNRDIT